ncbi:MAG: fasciclin domain-containing protein [Planctomycetes bacterium]|nr:fasciclin domain-containing protein [Planctomycetota bacterium]
MHRHLTLLCLLLHLAPIAPAQSRPAPARPARDLIESARAAGSFETLLAAVEAAGLVEVLRGEGPFTVLAPTDEAFGTLGADALQDLLRPENREQLVAILKNHVIAGSVSSADALRAGSATTLGGGEMAIRLEKGRLRIGAANVLENDLLASNGVIHAIDAVLLPPAAAAIPADRRAAGRLLLERTVELGAPLFNDGDPASCAALYETALLGLAGLGAELLDEAARREVDAARSDAAKAGTARERAWRLRRGIDAAYRCLLRDQTGDGAAPAVLRPRR